MKYKIVRLIEEYFLREQFTPSLIGLLINPFYFSRRAIYKSIKGYSGKVSGLILDIGCGSKPYESLFEATDYIGLDIASSGHRHDRSKIDIFFDGITIPFNNDFCDSIVCFEVLQLVFDPERFLAEANRVLKPGGTAIFTVPFIWDEHEQPFDYARYTSFGLKHLFEKSGFAIINSRKNLKDLRLISLLINAYIYKIIKKKISSKISFFLILPLTSLINIASLVFYIFPSNEDLYFGNIFLLKKLE